MTQQSPLTTLSPEDYAERFRQHQQRQVAATIDPGYLVDDTPAEWVVGMVLGYVEEGEPEHPVSRSVWRVRHAIASVAQRVADIIDPTVRYL